MRSNVGLVLVDLSGFTDREEVESLLTRAITLIPEGRNLVVLWRCGAEWTPQIPLEAWVTITVMKTADERGLDSLEFFGNGAVRTYQRDESAPKSTWYWLCFRRPGEKAYKRRNSARLDVIEASTLATLHPVFTRDAANNVWHVTDRTSKKAIRERFQVLLTWSDEITLEVRTSGSSRFERPTVSFSDGLIGTAAKTEYSWNPPSSSQQLF
jgi:hypothetical protein